MSTPLDALNREHLLLPHEMPLVQRDYEVMAARQRINGDLLGEAMAQSSETFHDNNPAELITSDQEVLMRGAKVVLYIFEHHVSVEYPDPEATEVCLGTRATISIDGGEAFDADIIGYRDPEREDDDVEQVSYLSPLGGALLGHPAGESVETVINDTPKTVTIVAVDQASLREHYEAQTIVRLLSLT